MNKPACRQCGKTQRVRVRRIINAGGGAMFAWRCLECNTWAENPLRYLSHTAMTEIAAAIGKTLDDIPIQDDYRQSCVICGGRDGAENHHWMPQALNDHPEVAPQWAAWEQFGALLCKYHHDLWHDLVTPWMPGRGNSRKVQHER